MRIAAPLAMAACLVATSPALAAPKAEDAIRYRQSVYTVIGWNFGTLADMAKDKQPFDAGEFTLRADRIADLAPQLLEGFPPGSDTGAKTGAKATIWTDRAGFEAKMQDFVDAARALSQAAHGGDEATMKERFKATAGTCKACHDQYRSRN
ncbi:MAG: cytochrome c [Xanthomonadales bacterium]|nr:cytochrome c [Xanthomonadales bacterium]